MFLNDRCNRSSIRAKPCRWPKPCTIMTGWSGMDSQSCRLCRATLIDASEVFRNAGQTAGIVVVGDNFISCIPNWGRRFG